MTVMHIGRKLDGSPFEIDIADFEESGLRVGVFGSSGAGKGYLAGVVLEELIDHYPVIMLDPEHELWTFQESGALVVGGPRGDAPFTERREPIEEAVRFAFREARILVFDLKDIAEDVERGEQGLQRAGELVGRVVWSVAEELRTRAVFAVSEAHIFAPQQVVKGGMQPQMLRTIAARGRRRGLSLVLETQRPADIQKSVIAQCNVRFLGRFDDGTDFDAIKRHLPKELQTLQAVQALDHEFYVRQAEGLIVARTRLVTHGGSTPPEGGEIKIGRRADRGALAEVIARLTEEAGRPPGATDGSASGTDDSGRTGRASAETSTPDARIWVRRSDHDTMVEALRDELTSTQDLLTAAERIASQAEAFRTSVADPLREAMHALLGPTEAVIQMPDGTTAETFMTGSVTEERVRELIHQHTPSGNGAVSLTPVEKLRSDFMEAQAQRIVERMRKLSADERRALLFLLTRDTYQSIAQIAKGLDGRGDGTVHRIWRDVLVALDHEGLVSKGGSGGSKYQEQVTRMIARELAPHHPSAEEITSVRDRALSVVMEDAR